MMSSERNLGRESSVKKVAGSFIEQDDGSGRRRSGYSLSSMQSIKNLNTNKGKEEEYKGPFILEGITSEIYGPHNPPKDWCDIGLLIPHEALRREMDAMTSSVTALKTAYDDDESWRVLYFAEWYIDVFSSSVHDHHSNEEDIYFPWIATRAEIPEKKYAKDHKELMDLLDAFGDTCEAVVKKKGRSCSEEIQMLKDKLPVLDSEFRAHLKEEEEMIPELLRANFTQEEEEVVIQKILKKEGLSGCRTFVPAIIFAMRKWAKPEFVEEFMGSMPPPIRKLLVGYYIPDYENYVYPMRDAPTLTEKPRLSKVGCCKIPFCFPCIM